MASPPMRKRFRPMDESYGQQSYGQQSYGQQPYGQQPYDPNQWSPNDKPESFGYNWEMECHKKDTYIRQLTDQLKESDTKLKNAETKLNEKRQNNFELRHVERFYKNEVKTRDEKLEQLTKEKELSEKKCRGVNEYVKKMNATTSALEKERDDLKKAFEDQVKINEIQKKRISSLLETRVEKTLYEKTLSDKQNLNQLLTQSNHLLTRVSEQCERQDEQLQELKKKNELKNIEIKRLQGQPRCSQECQRLREEYKNANIRNQKLTTSRTWFENQNNRNVTIYN